jgi:hypothetical protein
VVRLLGYPKEATYSFLYIKMENKTTNQVFKPFRVVLRITAESEEHLLKLLDELDHYQFMEEPEELTRI